MKKYMAFKASPFRPEEEDFMDENEEDFVMLVRKVGKMFYKKGRINS